jgi:hypothetical protein
VLTEELLLILGEELLPDKLGLGLGRVPTPGTERWPRDCGEALLTIISSKVGASTRTVGGLGVTCNLTSSGSISKSDGLEPALSCLTSGIDVKRFAVESKASLLSIN